MKKPMLKKSFRVPQEQWEVIEQLGKETGTTPSKVVRTILDEYIKYYKAFRNE